MIWCWFRLPETKGRTFGEIDILFENKISARKFKYTKVDGKYTASRSKTVISSIRRCNKTIEFAHQSHYNEKAGVDYQHDEDAEPVA